MKSMRQMALAIALVAATMPAGQALAGPIGDTGSLQWTRVNGYFTGNGGEFTAHTLTGISNASYAPSAKNVASAQSFETFCLEAGEYAASPSYFVVGSAASRGGEAVSDPISQGTAWLYSQFAQGTLSNYFTGSRAAKAGALQNAIWALENEIAAPSAGVNMFYDLALLNGGATTAAQGYLGVYVLNNFTTAAARDAFKANGAFNDGTKAQDFLYYSVPDGGTTLMLLGGALMGLGALRRKFNV